MNINIQDYVSNMKKIQYLLLQYIENEENIEINYQNIIQILNDKKIVETPHVFKSYLHILSTISRYHYRTINFFSKIEKLLNFSKNQIIKTFSNFDIFQIFKKNKRILLFLFTEKFISMDDSIISYITKEPISFFYGHFFSKEIFQYTNSIIDKNNSIRIDDNKRLIGENDSIICQLIRKDSIKEFVYITSQNQIDLQMKIESSIYETNSLFYLKDTKLIEYAAFFGSIKIFKYLIENNCQINSNLWNYAIHGKNFEIINILLENQIKPDLQHYEFVLREAIKCHHNEIAKFIYDNFIFDKSFSMIKQLYGYSHDLTCYSLHYYNFAFFPDDFINNELTFYYACQYDYFLIVDFLLKAKKIDINESMILKTLLFL